MFVILWLSTMWEKYTLKYYKTTWKDRGKILPFPKLKVRKQRKGKCLFRCPQIKVLEKK